MEVRDVCGSIEKDYNSSFDGDIFLLNKEIERLNEKIDIAKNKNHEFYCLLEKIETGNFEVDMEFPVEYDSLRKSNTYRILLGRKTLYVETFFHDTLGRCKYPVYGLNVYDTKRKHISFAIDDYVDVEEKEYTVVKQITKLIEEKYNKNDKNSKIL